ncbi:hypothetical protein RUM44_008187 [Polyplax serrata]|uniref:Uncharacterized protein n=1 Tax=Polyplax serrata TaxID=468196 RepID=A0ABR1BC09_POLSC
MSFRVLLTFITIYHLALVQVAYLAVRKILTKKMNYHRVQDYSFEGELNRASGECSYIFMVNDTAGRNRTIQLIKEKALNRKVKEFYEQKENEKRKSREYYETVQKETRRRIMTENNSNRRSSSATSKGKPRDRLVRSSSQKRGSTSSFSMGTFTDHNNCSSRCIFARMEIVNSLGFPDESLIIKLIDDKITNRKKRLSKKKKVSTCFNSMKKVAYDDSCIISARLFDCLEFGESYLWSNRK